MRGANCRSDCYRQDDSLDSGLSSDNSTAYRPAVPWSGNPADRSKLSHVRRPPDQPFQTAAGVPLSTSTLPHAAYLSDSEVDHTPIDAPRLGWGGQRVRGGQCASGERRVQDWTLERNVSGGGGRAAQPAADYYTLGARRHRQLYNGVAPAISTGVTVDNPLAANANRYVALFISAFGLP